MASPPPRNTTRQREAAATARAETRRRLLAAAGEEFAERGYVAATVKRIAERAGVTVQTLYLAWTNKASLLRAHLETSLADRPDTDTPYADAISEVMTRALDDADGDPVAVIDAFAALFRHVAARAAGAWKLYRDAAAIDPEIAAEWHDLQRLRRDTFTQFIDQIPLAALRDGLSRQRAIDTAWAIASPETYDLLVVTDGFTLDDYEAWVATTLTAALLADGHRHT